MYSLSLFFKLYLREDFSIEKITNRPKTIHTVHELLKKEGKIPWLDSYALPPDKLEEFHRWELGA